MPFEETREIGLVVKACRSRHIYHRHACPAQEMFCKSEPGKVHPVPCTASGTSFHRPVQMVRSDPQPPGITGHGNDSAAPVKHHIQKSAAQNIADCRPGHERIRQLQEQSECRHCQFPAAGILPCPQKPFKKPFDQPGIALRNRDLYDLPAPSRQVSRATPLHEL